jgi:D-3-phosphoglycerate dehydrogenase
MKIAVMGSVHLDGWEILKKANLKPFEIINFDEKNIIEELKDVDGILLRTSKLTSSILSKINNLKIVSRHGVGYDNVDLEYLNINKIALGITGTSNAVSVAEHVLTCFLYLAKNIHLSDKLTKSGKFRDKASLPDFFELYGKNVLICGFGRIGKAVAKRCLGFDAKVYVFDPFVKNQEIESLGCITINKDDGIKLADYITIHLPLNEKTKNFISYNEFEIMKNSAVIVNTARGGIINEKSLVNALEKKIIRGAGLDVFETEPPSHDNLIFKLPNVILSPHNAALTLECRKRMAKEAANNIINFLSKSKDLNINNIINRSVLSL